jgi:hypothetical protein
MGLLTNLCQTKLWVFSLLCALGGWCGCERAVDIQLPDHESQPVLYAMLEPGTPPLISLQRSKAIFDTTAFAKITNANIRLEVPGQSPLSFVSMGDGLYRDSSGWVPGIGDTISLRVEIPGEKEMTILPVAVPSPVTIVSATFTDSVFSSPYRGSDGLLSIEIQDAIGQADFYQVRIFGLKDTLRSAISGIPLLENGLTGSTCEFNGRFFDDLCHDGEIWQWQWQLSPRFLDSDAGEMVLFDRIEVRVAAISPSWFWFLESRNQAGGLEALFLLDNEVYSNVINGVGVVGARTDSILEIAL